MSNVSSCYVVETIFHCILQLVARSASHGLKLYTCLKKFTDTSFMQVKKKFNYQISVAKIAK